MQLNPPNTIFEFSKLVIHLENSGLEVIVFCFVFGDSQFLSVITRLIYMLKQLLKDAYYNLQSYSSCWMEILYFIFTLA